MCIKILSNLCTDRMTMSEFKIPIKDLQWKNTPGDEVAKRVL